MNFLKILSIFAIITSTSCSSVNTSNNPATTTEQKNMFLGTWLSDTVETRPDGNGGSLYLKRKFTITNDKSIGDFTFYADKEGKTVNMLLHFEGPYTLGKASTALTNATEGEFPFEVVKLTPKNDGITGFLNTSAPNTCGKDMWKTDVEQDLTPTKGCKTIGFDIEKCPKEYDLIKVEGNKLFFGARPSDGSGLCSAEKRPTSFQVPVIKQN